MIVPASCWYRRSIPDISYAIAYANLSQVYKGIASEAYRRAISQSSEPAKYTHDIELTAITCLDNASAESQTQIASLPTSQAVLPKATVKEVHPWPKWQVPPQVWSNVANLDTLMIEKVMQLG